MEADLSKLIDTQSDLERESYGNTSAKSTAPSSGSTSGDCSANTGAAMISMFIISLNIMSSVVQEIQAIHALRKNIRDLTISPALLKSIESIHHSIHSSAEQNGWKTVDWRGPARTPRDNEDRMNVAINREAIV